MTGVAKIFWDLWFPRSVRRAVIIAPAADDNLSDASLTARNYALFDRLGDRDSVYALGVLLGRRYPKIELTVVSCADFDAIPLTENLIVVGGPGEYVPAARQWVAGNRVCRTFHERVPSHFSYSDDCETLRADGGEYSASFDGDGRMTRDYGVFRRFVNPFNRSSAIVMLHGIHTLGVLGATRLFDGSDDSQANLALVEGLGLTPKLGFECFFDVDVLNGQVATPSLLAERCFSLDGRDGSSRSTVTAVRNTGLEMNGATLDELRRDVDALIRVALDRALDLRRPEIGAVLEKFRLSQLNEKQCYRLLEICRSNPMLPRERLDEISSVLSA